MNAQMGGRGPRAGRDAEDCERERVSAPALDDSWFKWPKPITQPPQPPPVLDDGLADAWFR